VDKIWDADFVKRGFGEEQNEPALNKAWIETFFLRGFHKCVGKYGDNLYTGQLEGTIFSHAAVDEVKFQGNKVSTPKRTFPTPSFTR
jgi:hypothetical protein